MDIVKAAQETRPYVDKTNLPLYHPHIGKRHLWTMISKIITKDVENEKAHRWLGWVQACICFGDGAPIETFKEINRNA